MNRKKSARKRTVRKYMAVLFSYILEKLCNFHAQKKVMAVLIKNIRISIHVMLYPRIPE